MFSLDCLLQDRSDEPPPAPCAAPAPKKSGAEWRTDERATMCTPVHCLMPPFPFTRLHASLSVSTGACSAAAPPPLYLVEQAVRNRRGADVSFASVPMNDIAALALQRHRTYFSQCEATRGAFYLQEDNLWWRHRYLMDGQGSGGARLKRVKVISGGEEEKQQREMLHNRNNGRRN